MSDQPIRLVLIDDHGLCRRGLSELLDAGTAVVSVTHDAEFSAVLGGTELRLRPRETAAADAPGPDLELPEGASP